MKNLLLIPLQLRLFCIFSVATISINAQTDCTHNVSTDPSNPTNSSLPVVLDEFGNITPTGDLYLNGFDWLATSGGIYTQYATDNMFFAGAPYVMNNIMSTSIPEYNYISANVAPLLENGWELLLVNLGRFPNDSDIIPIGSNDNTAFPYIALYNKYSGIIRVFTNFGDDSDAGQGGNALQITLGFEYPNIQDVSGILRLYGGVDQALNETTNLVKANAIVVKPAQGSHWASADFQMSYDPCTCFTTTRLQIGISSFLTSDIKLKGRSVSIEDALTDGSGNVNPTVQDFLNGFELTATGEADDGIIIYKNIISAIDEYTDKFQKYKDNLALVAEHNEKVERNLLLLKAGKFVLGALTGVGATGATTVAVEAIGASTSTANALLELKKGFVNVNNAGQKFFDTKKVMDAVKAILGEEGKTFIANNFEVKTKPSSPTMPTVTLSEMVYAGTLTTPASVGAVSFYSPGVYGSSTTGSPALTSYYEYPIYNEVLGTFALLRKPRIKISKTLVETRNDLFDVVHQNIWTMKDELYLTRYQNWEWNYQIQLNEDLKFAINDVPDVKSYSVKAAYVVKAKVTDQNLSWLSSDYRYINARQGSENVNVQSTNSETDTLGYPIISGDEPFEHYAPHFYSTLGSPPPAMDIDITHETIVAQTPFIPIDAFKPFTAGISLMNEGISFKSYDDVSAYDPASHSLDPIPMNAVGFQYDFEVELKLMVDIEFNTLNSDGEYNSTTMLLTYPINDIYESPSELVPNLPGSLKNIGQYENVREYGDIHFSGQEVPGCSRLGMIGGGDIYACYAIDEIIINGDITAANDGTQVMMRAGNQITTTAESSISPEVHREIFSVYDYSNPMPKVNQQYVNDFCQGTNGQNYAYAASSYVPQGPKSFTTTQNPPESENMEDDSYGIRVYPNPTREILNVQFNFGEGASGEFVIYDLLGTKVHSLNLVNDHKIETLNISELSAGTYIYSYLINGAQKSTGKIVVQ